MFLLWKWGNKMAQIQEKLKNGKIVSFKIKVFLGRDDDGTKRSESNVLSKLP